MSSLLIIKNLHASYDKLQVLRGIDLEIKRGEIVLIIGHNGSGKSTLLKCIVGLIQKDNGQIVFHGSQMTFVPQGRRIFDSMTVEENLAIGGYRLKMSNVKRQMSKIFEMFPVLKQKRNQRANLLSGGQQQILSIGRGLMTKPDLLILDEPSLGTETC